MTRETTIQMLWHRCTAWDNQGLKWILAGGRIPRSDVAVQQEKWLTSKWTSSFVLWALVCDQLTCTASMALRQLFVDLANWIFQYILTCYMPYWSIMASFQKFGTLKALVKVISLNLGLLSSNINDYSP